MTGSSELELTVILSLSMWMLGTAGPLQVWQVFLPTELSFQPHYSYCYKKLIAEFFTSVYS